MKRSYASAATVKLTRRNLRAAHRAALAGVEAVGLEEPQPDLAQGGERGTACQSVSTIDLPVLGDDGRPRHSRGMTDDPGLYFLGLSWQHTRGSALLGWVGDDAEFIAGEMEAAVGLETAAGAEATNYECEGAPTAAALEGV
jgi:hypothetical protein